MNINELMELLKNSNDKYSEDNDNYYADTNIYTNIEIEKNYNYEF